MLTVFGSFTHGLDDLLPSLDVPTLDHPNTDLVTVAHPLLQPNTRQRLPYTLVAALQR